MDEIKERDVIRSLARGLAVMRAFERGPAWLTPSDVARRAEITRAAARRSLLTLVVEGYARTDGKRFCLTPSALAFGRSYLSSSGILDRTMPAMEQLSRATGMKGAVAVLEDGVVRIVARVPARESVDNRYGTNEQIAAHTTALGHVLLASLPSDAFEAYLDDMAQASGPSQPIVDRDALRQMVTEVRRAGWAMVDQEPCSGGRTVAVPLRDERGAVQAAIGLSGEGPRPSFKDFRSEVLPRLRALSDQVSDRLLARGSRPTWRRRVAPRFSAVSGAALPVGFSR